MSSPPCSRAMRLTVFAFLAFGVLLYSFLSRVKETASPSICQAPTRQREKELLLMASQFTDFDVKCKSSVPLDTVRDVVIQNVHRGVDPFLGFPDPALRKFLNGTLRVRGWGSQNAVFKMLIEEVRPRVILEIGTFLGASAIHMGNVTRELGLESTILCVDDFRGWPGFRDTFESVKEINGDVLLLQHFMMSVVYSHLEDRVVPIPYSTSHALKALCDMGVTADLIEVDAGHDFRSAWNDINLAYSLLTPRGVMFGHDYRNKADRKGVKRAVHLFAKLHNLDVEPNEQHWILRPR